MDKYCKQLFELWVVAFMDAAQRLDPPVPEEAVVVDAVVEMAAERNHRRNVNRGIGSGPKVTNF